MGLMLANTSTMVCYNKVSLLMKEKKAYAGAGKQEHKVTWQLSTFHRTVFAIAIVTKFGWAETRPIIL